MLFIYLVNSSASQNGSSVDIKTIEEIINDMELTDDDKNSLMAMLRQYKDSHGNLDYQAFLKVLNII